MCKRMLVQALAVDVLGNIAFSTNSNDSECTGEVGNCGCTHAEINVLRKMKQPITLYLSHSPCEKCAQALIKSTIKTVIYENEYRKTEGIELLKYHGIEVKKGE